MEEGERGKEERHIYEGEELNKRGRGGGNKGKGGWNGKGKSEGRERE